MKQLSWALCSLLAVNAAVAVAAEVPRIDTRFASADVQETPDFRQHIVPLMGKLGCNGRACHGSFQGQGGFRLSLFGYDFKADHENIALGEEPRVDLQDVDNSLILQKGMTVIDHEGGKRFDADTWQHRVLRKWVAAGAKPINKDDADFVRLEITPSEMIAKQKGDTWQLKAVAVWTDGTREDVTPLCRFQSNDDQVAAITDDGLVTSTGPGDTHVVAFYDNGVVPVPVIHPVSDKVGPKYPAAVTPTPIDQHVINKLRKLGIVQADVCTDAEFLRRVSLDMIGTLPTPAEVTAFLDDSSADKRSKKIDELLERPEYAAWWATKLADWTGNNSGKQRNVPPGRDQISVDWYNWLTTRVEQNMPYDQLVEGIVLAKSRLDGEGYEDYSKRMSGYYAADPKGSYADQPYLPHFWGRTNFTNPDDRALGFAYTFLGVRIQCAQCHKHPFDQWTKDDFDNFKQFFGGVRYGNNPADRKVQDALLAALPESVTSRTGGQLQNALQNEVKRGKVVPFQELIVATPNNNRRNANNPNARRQVVSGRTAKVLGGEETSLADLDDPRTALMDWMRDPENPYFAQAFVNRVWSGYFHRGIVEPTDDLSLANPPCNAELLAYLAQGFRDSGYDMKWLHREIANSRTYQLSWQTNDTNQLDERNFSRAVPRRLPAEVAYDAVAQATASNQELANRPGKLDGRAIAEAVYSSRNANRGNSAYALMVFGRSIRESNCDCDRSGETSLLQTVFLQNDQQVLSELSGRNSWVDEVVKGPAVPGADERLARAQRQVERFDTMLDRALKRGNNERIAEARQQLAEAKKELARLQDAAKPAKSGMPDEDRLAEVVRQAYLRTVSRYPTEAELGRSVSYFQETGDLGTGARDLLWALLNTKEFIANH